MENLFISRRFVRIKALQNIYAYTIAEQAHKKEAIEQVKKGFIFDSFLNEPEQKEQLAKEQSLAVAFCYESIARQLPVEAIFYEGNKKIEESVRRHLGDYITGLRQDRIFLHNGLSQAKESICINILYILLLLLEWYKLAKSAHTSSKQATPLLIRRLSENPLLEELCKDNKWLKIIGKNGINWAKDEDKVENWYNTFMHSGEISKKYRPDDVNFLVDLIKHIILKENAINDSLAMKDLYWDEHKPIVEKILAEVFTILSTKDFDQFTLLWEKLEKNCAKEAIFYNHLCTVVMQNNVVYEAMIGEKSEKWDSERILLTDKLILKLALAEMLECKEIPFKVSINEYIEIAKWYGTAKSGAFVNGVLEGVIKGLDKPTI